MNAEEKHYVTKPRNSQTLVAIPSSLQSLGLKRIKSKLQNFSVHHKATFFVKQCCHPDYK
jgi:hypothetical protein